MESLGDLIIFFNKIERERMNIIINLKKQNKKENINSKNKKKKKRIPNHDPEKTV